VRFLNDQYYADEPMTSLDKALFAFAWYDVGARTVSRRCAGKPRKSGLDHNFHIVGHVAEEKIGPETVP
jgi:hypothetical protein